MINEEKNPRVTAKGLKESIEPFNVLFLECWDKVLKANEPQVDLGGMNRRLHIRHEKIALHNNVKTP